MKSNIIEAYVDGACQRNPGPAGIGIVLICGNNALRISKFLGDATNNIAELSAISCALDKINKKDYRVIIHTDSQYAIGALSKNWKITRNKEIIESIKEKLLQFNDLTFVWVKGHASNKYNEMVDYLAKKAVSSKKNTEERGTIN